MRVNDLFDSAAILSARRFDGVIIGSCGKEGLANHGILKNVEQIRGIAPKIGLGSRAQLGRQLVVSGSPVTAVA